MDTKHRIVILIRKNGIVNSIVENNIPSRVSAENRMRELISTCKVNDIEVINVIITSTKERNRSAKGTDS